MPGPPCQDRHDHHLSDAATALLAAADHQPQHVGVYLYCIQAADLLRTVGAHAEPREPRDELHASDAAHRSDSESLIRSALRSLAALPPDQFTLDPVVHAARAARRALHLLGDPPTTNAYG